MGIGLRLFGRRKDGTEVPVEISLSPSRTEHGLLICSVIRDITARQELEAQLETSRMQVVSSARLSALGMMAGEIAYEVNNPLGIIHAYASICSIWRATVRFPFQSWREPAPTSKRLQSESEAS